MQRDKYSASIDVPTEATKDEIGRTALQGALNVMSTAGISDREIARLLKQAASVFEENPSLELEDAPQEFVGCDHPITSYEIDRRFEKIQLYKILSRLNKRMDSIRNWETVASCEKAEALISDSLPSLKAALSWYQDECSKHDLILQLDREQWLEQASDDDLDNEEAYIFYDSTAGLQTFALWNISQYAHAAARLGRAQQLQTVLEAIVEQGVILDKRTFDDLTEALSNASFKAFIENQVRALEGGFEMAQSDFIHALARSANGEVSEHLIATWLEDFGQAGILERYKRSNRWQIRRL